MEIKVGQIRQGDVLLVPVDVTPPSNATVVSELVLARGELTGHAHRLTAKAGIVTWRNFVVVQGDSPGFISHEEHDQKPAPVVVPGQVYEIVIQEEFGLDGMWRKVVD